MRKLWASIQKEFLMLVRDLGGLIILFVMPIVLVVTITLIQDSTFKSVSGSTIDILLVDLDKGKLSEEIYKNFEETPFLNPISTAEGELITEAQASYMVASGTYQLAVIIPEGLSRDLNTQITKNIADILEEFEGNAIQDTTTATVVPEIASKVSAKEVTIYFDPITQETFRSAVIATVDKLIASIETKTVYQAFEKEMGTSRSMESFSQGHFVQYKQINPSLSGEAIIPNSVQHNVPAWTLFAIFFMVLPLALNIVHEKGQGTFIRLQTTPVHYLTIIGGKAVVFLGVSIVQFTMILLFGMYLFPFLGLPFLVIGDALGVLYVVAIASGLASIGLAILLGTLLSTAEQAAPFCAVLVVVLAAIGGVWVPVFVMPKGMQMIAKISPMNWGLEAFYDCFLRKGDFFSILPEISLLLLFFISTVTIAMLYHEKKKKV